jgi:hypothetical protein
MVQPDSQSAKAGIISTELFACQSDFADNDSRNTGFLLSDIPLSDAGDGQRLHTRQSEALRQAEYLFQVSRTSEVRLTSLSTPTC